MLLPSRVLRATVVATLSLVASAAHAVPYMPTELPATFDTLSIVNTGAGASFAVVVGSSGFMYTQNASAGLEDTTPALVRLTTRRSSTTTTAYATRQGTDVRVADGVVTFHFDPAASPPTATDLLALGDQTAVGLGESDTNAPKIALWGPTGLSVTTVGQDISRATPVGTPDLKPLVGDIGKFWANDTFGVVAYASRASGVRVVMLDGKGTPSAAPPLTLNGANVSKIAVTPLGTDVLVTTTKELSLTVSRIDADAKVVKEQDLPLDTVGVVTDASAGSGPDALIVQHDRTERVSLSSWSALSSAGATNPWTLVPERVSGRFSGGACSTSGCMLGFVAGRTYTLLWAGRDGRTAVRVVASPLEPTDGTGGGGGRALPVPPSTNPIGAEDGAAEASGCSAASTHAGGGLGGGLLVGLGALVATARRRRTSSR
jgi:hypothetical protein